jgi:hypothetical protein
MSGHESAKKRPALKKEIESLIKRTGYTIFKDFIKEP